MAPKFRPRFESLANCQAGELLRVSYKGETRWAVIAAQGGPNLRPLAILSGDGSPCWLNIVDDGSLRPEFEMHHVLAYAKKDEYRIIPDYMGECHIDEGANFQVNGALILAKSGMWLRLLSSKGGADFLSLCDYVVSGNPPQPPVAAFKKWTLTCELFEGLDPPFLLAGPPLTPRPKVPWDAFGWTGLDERAAPAGS
jgi:hypothetical protein